MASRDLPDLSHILSPRDRIRLIERVLSDGESIPDVCRDFGVSRPTFYKWKRRYLSVGEGDRLEAVGDRIPRRRKIPAQRIPQKIEERVFTVAVAHPNWGKRRIHAFLLRQGHRVGIHGVSNALRRLCLSTPELRERRRLAQEKAIPHGRLLAPKDRLSLVERILIGRLPISVVSKDSGVSRLTIYKWL